MPLKIDYNRPGDRAGVILENYLNLLQVSGNFEIIKIAFVFLPFKYGKGIL